MISEAVYLEYLSNLLEGNKPKCSAIVEQLLKENVDPKELYEKLFKRSLERVGKLWESERICGATEHMATAITECLMSLTYPIISNTKKNGKKAVIACVPREFHQVGAKMVADVFEQHGWESYFLGANTKVSELMKMLEEKKPEVLALSVSLYLNILRLKSTIEEVIRKYPDIEIIVGGRAFIEKKPDFLVNYSNVTFINSIGELEEFINSYQRVEKEG
ncbi:MAG: B12-binding domain-containing protein [Bacillota bacterium]